MKYGSHEDRIVINGRERRGRKDDPDLTARLEAAMIGALADDGFETLRLEDLAKTAGTSKQAIYRRWPSKEAFALEALRHGLHRIPAPVPERANAARDLYRLVAAYRAGLAGPLGLALVRVRALKAFAPLVAEFEDEVRFHVRQCLIATPFDRDLEVRATLVLGLLWQDLFDRHLRSGALEDGGLESAIYLLLGLVAPRAAVGGSVSAGGPITHSRRHLSSL